MIWFISGFYTIREAERGVVLRFGEYYQQVEPGLRWAPTFTDTVIPVDVQSIRDQSSSGSMLTEDENIVQQIKLGEKEIIEIEVNPNEDRKDGDSYTSVVLNQIGEIYNIPTPIGHIGMTVGALALLVYGMLEALRYSLGHYRVTF